MHHANALLALRAGKPVLSAFTMNAAEASWCPSRAGLF
jgi:hypothetical protein